ncbi:MAG TPA: hypothetical protein VFV81_02125, partial [Verrucomicrobiae bacterium]|nr:hypothetical protein [Verrucomicrobiae bacterium]
AILIFSLLMACGRFAPAFYGAFYQLPYASSIRNPAKFLIVFNFATVILFALGVHGLSRLYLQPSGVPAALGSWWARVRGFDRRWTIGSVAALLLSLVAWLAYISNESKLVAYLKRRGFPDDQFARDIAAFSVGQAGWFLLFFALSVGLVILVVAGVFSGRRARLGGILLGALLIVDLGRANLPWIIHWDYKQKYEIGALNPIAKFLAQKPYEHRVAALPFNTPEGYEIFSGPGGLYSIEWLQHLFPYYNIPTLDKIQMPREPIDLEAFERSLIPHTMADVSLFTRFWQLTATRYLLGPAGYIDLLNSQIDPQQHRFRIAQRFNIVLKPGVEQFHQRLEELTAVVDDNGPFALFEFTGARPRVKLYTHWETNSAADVKNFSTNGLDDNQLYVFNEAGTNGFLTLQKLASPSFDAGKTVLLDAPLPEGNPAGATNANSGTVDFESYAPRDIKLKANAVAPSVLLLNDKFDPNWTVTVDGRPSTIFHANFIMRGVFLNPGEHVVEFRFNLPNGPLYVTIAGVAVTLLIIVVLIFLRNRAESPAQR